MAKKLQYIGSMIKKIANHESITVPEGEVWRIQATSSIPNFKIYDDIDIDFATGHSGLGLQSFLAPAGTKITQDNINGNYKAVISALKFKEVEI